MAATEIEERFPAWAQGKSGLAVVSFDCFEDGEGKVFEGVELRDRLSFASLRVWIEHRSVPVELVAGVDGHLQPFCRANVRRARTRRCCAGEGRPQPSSLEEVFDIGLRGQVQLPAPAMGDEADRCSTTETMSESDGEFAEALGASEVAGIPARALGEGATATRTAVGDSTASAEGAASAEGVPLWERFEHGFAAATAAAAKRFRRAPGNVINNTFWTEADDLLAESAVLDLTGAIHKSAPASAQQSERSRSVAECVSLHVGSTAG